SRDEAIEAAEAASHAEHEPVAADLDEDASPEDDDVELVTGMSSDDETENLDWLDEMPADQDRTRESAPEVEAGLLPRDIDPEVFMLNVVSRDPTGFSGEDILHILLACDLRFGDMNFFHRHEFEAGRGAIQFSVANMMQPGVFDIDNMAQFNTPGLVFFLTLPGPEDMMKAFDYMLETAQAVARNLGGDVLDESRSVVTKQTLEHCRQQIRDLERRMLAKAR
ncbi:MAG: cell division protein ZipA, partial [Halieaceae bacterium]